MDSNKFLMDSKRLAEKSLDFCSKVDAETTDGSLKSVSSAAVHDAAEHVALVDSFIAFVAGKSSGGQAETKQEEQPDQVVDEEEAVEEDAEEDEGDQTAVE